MNWLILLSHCALQSLRLSKGPALPKTSQPPSHRRSAWSAGWKECPSPPFSGTKTGSKLSVFHASVTVQTIKQTDFEKWFDFFISRLVFLGDPNLEVSDRGQVLKIKSARLGDKARYQCSVMNTAGKQSKDFNLSVYGEGFILQILKNKHDQIKLKYISILSILMPFLQFPPPSKAAT